MTKPIHALTAYVPSDIWCRLMVRPPPPHCAVGLKSILGITLTLAGCDVGLEGFINFDTRQRIFADRG